MIQIIRKDYSAEDYQQQGKKCIAEYYKRYHPFDQGKTLGLEEYINFPLRRKGLLDPGLYRPSDPGGSIPSSKSTTTRPPTGFQPRKRLIQTGNSLFIRWEWKKSGRGFEEVRLIWHYLAFDAEINLQGHRRSPSASSGGP